jgi:plasmid stabilization system protein ParE
MAAYSVDLLSTAENDLDEICLYLSQFYPGTVDRFLEDFGKALDYASDNPKMYQTYDLNKAYRRIVVGNYLVFYKIDEAEKRMKVYRVLHGKRNLPEFLK